MASHDPLHAPRRTPRSAVARALARPWQFPFFMWVARLGMLGLIGACACTIPNETHCGNQRGDATCAERFGAPMYCDVCVAVNDGCVDAMPEAACRFGEPDPAASTSTASSGTPIDPSTSTSATTSPGTTVSSSSSGTTMPSDSEESTADATSTTDAVDDSTGGETVDPTEASTGATTEGSESASTTESAMTTGSGCTPLLDPCETTEECCGELVCGVLTHTCGVA